MRWVSDRPGRGTVDGTADLVQAAGQARGTGAERRRTAKKKDLQSDL